MAPMTLDGFDMPIIIGNNKILTLVTEQSYWSLFQAESMASGDHLWFQILNEQACGDSHLTSLFFKAAAVSKAIDHPNAIGTIDYGEHEEMYYAVHSYAQGNFLQDLLDRQETLSEEKVLFLIKTVSQTLQVVHMKGFRHGLMTPASIFLTESGDLLLFNFGMGPLVDYTLFTKNDPGAMAFADYLSPERLKNRGGTENKGEIFSLGLIAYQCLTGQNPRQELSRDDLMTGPDFSASSISDIVPGVSYQTEHIIQKMLAPQDNRYENFVELLQDLEPRPIEIFQDDEPDAPTALSERLSNWFQWILPKDPTWVGNRVRMVRIFAPLLMILLLIFFAFLINLQSGSSLDEEKLLYQEFVEEIELQERQNSWPEQNLSQADTEPESLPVPDKRPAQVSPPRIEPSPEFVSLTIHVEWVEPAEASVYINDKFAGLLQGSRTFLAKEVQPNRTYRIRVEAEGYETVNRTITAALQGPNELFIDLTPLERPSRAVNFTQVPFASEMSINGHLQRTNLPVQIELTEGLYQVTYYESRAGFQWTTRVRITASSPSDIQFDASALGNGTLSVVLENALQFGYAYVTLDGKRESQSTPVRFTLAAGWHRIKIEREGFKVTPSDTSVFVKPNERLVIDCRITPR